MKLLITQSQSILDQVAGGVERFVGIFTWAEPRVTAMTILVVMALGWSTLHIQTIVELVLIDDKRRRQSYFQDCAGRVKFACIAYLWLLRHRHLPGRRARAIQEEKNARIERSSLLRQKSEQRAERFGRG